MKLTVWDASGEVLGTVQDSGLRVIAKPAYLASLTTAARREGATAAQSVAILDGWSNGYIYVGTDNIDEEEPEAVVKSFEERAYEVRNRAARVR